MNQPKAYGEETFPNTFYAIVKGDYEKKSTGVKSLPARSETFTDVPLGRSDGKASFPFTIPFLEMLLRTIGVGWRKGDRTLLVNQGKE